MAADLTTTEDGYQFYTNSTAKEEAQFFYKEIFHDKSYDVAELPDDAVIVDAGANIGLFSLYMKQRHPSSRILAFEPAPESVQTFKRNMQLHKITGVDIHQCGLGRDEDVGQLTFYPILPGNSTLHPQQKLDTLALLPDNHPLRGAWTENIEKISIDIKPLSWFLGRIPDLTRIDLLKVDVEGAELDALAGVGDNYWKTVQNVALEISDIDGSMAAVEQFLQSKGFTVSKTSPYWAPEDFKMFMLVAKRESGG
jgi:FkbM family methyltransferase